MVSKVQGGCVPYELDAKCLHMYGQSCCSRKADNTSVVKR